MEQLEHVTSEIEEVETLQPSRVDLSDDARMAEWCEILNCSKDDLQRAVRVVGTGTKQVQHYLERQRKQQYWI